MDERLAHGYVFSFLLPDRWCTLYNGRFQGPSGKKLAIRHAKLDVWIIKFYCLWWDRYRGEGVVWSQIFCLQVSSPAFCRHSADQRVFLEAGLCWLWGGLSGGFAVEWCFVASHVLEEFDAAALKWDLYWAWADETHSTVTQRTSRKDLRRDHQTTVTLMRR